MAAPHSFPGDLTQQKAVLRARSLALRPTLDPAMGGRLAAHVLADSRVRPGLRVAGVWPLPGEIDLRGLWLALHQRGHTVLLPQTPPRGQALIFREWGPGCAMVTERFGTLCPGGPQAVPDLIFVPLLAFDARGNRLGYGGGYYDRTLAALPNVPAFGFGYAALQVDHVPAGPHDCALKTVFTENGVAVERE